MESSSTRPTPSLLYLVKRLELVIRGHLDDMLRGSEVTTAQYTALTVLAHRDGISAAQLARDSFVTPQSVADMLRLLEGQGLIRRVPNPANRREVRVCITAGGRELLNRYSGPAAALEDRLTSAFSPAEIASFREALGATWAALR